MKLLWANFLEASLLGISPEPSGNFSEQDSLSLLSTQFKISTEHAEHGTTRNGFTINNKLSDTEHTYAINDLGYRSPMPSNTDIVFAGCSQTFGIGVPENAIWGSVLANMMGMSYINVSVPGASIQWIIQKLFAYFKEYGNPKVVACLFPDFYRMILPVKDGLFDTVGSRQGNLSSIHLASRSQINKRPRYSKAPHMAEDVLPLEIPLYISSQYIAMLEQYCNSNNIKLVWSTWSFAANEVIQKYQSYGIFSNYVSIDNNLWLDYYSKDILYANADHAGYYDENAEQVNCHQEYKGQHPHCFDKGTDIEAGELYRHMGTHRHLHTAEAFAKKLMNRRPGYGA